MAEPLYGAAVGAARLVFRTLGFRFDLAGTDRLPAVGGAVLAANHVSYLDFLLVGRAVLDAGRKVRFLAMREVFEHRLGGPLLRGMGHIPVDRTTAGAGHAAYQAAVQALRAGELVCVFPEAGISETEELKPFKNGAVRLAAQAGVPLIPLGLTGGELLWPGSGPVERWTRRLPMVVRVGAPLELAADQDPTEATALLRARIEELLAEARAAHRTALASATGLDTGPAGQRV